MRALKRYDRRGFTLVELMIVVAIIGVLAALAVYGVTRYLASAKTSEAKNTVGAISRAAAAAYDREIAASEILENGTATQASRALCDTAGAVPTDLADVANRKYQPNTAPDTDFDTGTDQEGWRCLKFSMSQPIYYQYNYTRGANTPNMPGTPPGVGAGAAGFEAGAIGDLDGDGVYSGFARGGTIFSGQLALATTVYAFNEFE
ncbi:type II secretion system protein [Sorangium sp. So ce1036]|uniref:type IV pilin protein n=1 Tax=Sorangium sp. So ce1036 TaxID=3133328 RepID=UPI003EFD0EF3